MDDERRSAAKNNFAVIHLCEALAGGIVKVIVPLANETAAAGVPTVVVYGRRPETPDELVELFDPRVELVSVRGWGRRSGYDSVASAMRAAATLRRELGRYEHGVLHMHSTYAGLVGRLLPTPGWKRFYTPHGFAFHNDSHPTPVRATAFVAERLLARRAHVLACSLTEGEDATERLRSRSVSVVQNGLDVDSLPSFAPEPNGELMVASVGRVAYQRRPDLFAEVAALLRGEEARFVWLGDGPERATLARAGVSVSGWLSHDEVVSAMSDANVIVHFSAFEGLPLALLEAMTAGRAVVASDLPVIREVVADTAVLVQTPNEAARAIRNLAADADRRRELGLRARDRVRRLYTQDAMVGRTLAAYGLTSASEAPERARRP
ncbi:MAG TPA: glycosyltransferase [Gaiellaceae bacterium]